MPNGICMGAGQKKSSDVSISLCAMSTISKYHSSTSSDMSHRRSVRNDTAREALGNRLQGQTHLRHESRTTRPQTTAKSAPGWWALTSFVEEAELHADAGLQQAVLVAVQRADEEHRDADRVDQNLGGEAHKSVRNRAEARLV